LFISINNAEITDYYVNRDSPDTSVNIFPKRKELPMTFAGAPIIDAQSKSVLLVINDAIDSIAFACYPILDDKKNKNDLTVNDISIIKNSDIQPFVKLSNIYIDFIYKITFENNTSQTAIKTRKTHGIITPLHNIVSNSPDPNYLFEKPTIKTVLNNRGETIAENLTISKININNDLAYFETDGINYFEGLKLWDLHAPFEDTPLLAFSKDAYFMIKDSLPLLIDSIMIYELNKRKSILFITKDILIKNGTKLNEIKLEYRKNDKKTKPQFYIDNDMKNNFQKGNSQILINPDFIESINNDNGFIHINNSKDYLDNVYILSKKTRTPEIEIITENDVDKTFNKENEAMFLSNTSSAINSYLFMDTELLKNTKQKEITLWSDTLIYSREDQMQLKIFLDTTIMSRNSQEEDLYIFSNSDLLLNSKNKFIQINDSDLKKPFEFIKASCIGYKNSEQGFQKSSAQIVKRSQYDSLISVLNDTSITENFTFELIHSFFNDSVLKANIYFDTLFTHLNPNMKPESLNELKSHLTDLIAASSLKRDSLIFLIHGFKGLNRRDIPIIINTIDFLSRPTIDLKKLKRTYKNKAYFDYLNDLGIPNSTTEALILSPTMNISIGAPLLDTMTSTVVALKINEYDTLSFAVIPNMNNFKKTNELSSNESLLLTKTNHILLDYKQKLYQINLLLDTTVNPLETPVHGKSPNKIMEAIDSISNNSKNIFEFSSAIYRLYEKNKDKYIFDVINNPNSIPYYLKDYKDEVSVKFLDLMKNYETYLRFLYRKEDFTQEKLDEAFKKSHKLAKELYFMIDTITVINKEEHKCWKADGYDLFRLCHYYLKVINMDAICQELTSTADSLFREREYNEALFRYFAFMSNKCPNEKIARRRIDFMITQSSKYHNLAEQFYENKQYNKAIDMCDSVLSIFPTDKSIIELKRKSLIKSKLKEKILIEETIKVFQSNFKSNFVIIRNSFIGKVNIPYVDIHFRNDGEYSENYEILIDFGHTPPMKRDSSNYYVGLRYENFPPGKYKYNSADTAINLIARAFNSAIYELGDKILMDSVFIDFIGYADGIPYRSNLKCDESHFPCGNINKQLVATPEQHNNATKFRSLRTKRSNPNLALAFARAYYAKCFFEAYNDKFKDQIKTFALENRFVKGKQYRKVQIKIRIKFDVNKIDKK
jgi:hypothetical protein